MGPVTKFCLELIPRTFAKIVCEWFKLRGRNTKLSVVEDFNELSFYLENDASRSNQHCHSEDPKKQTIQHLGYIFPVLNYLKGKLISWPCKNVTSVTSWWWFSNNSNLQNIITCFEFFKKIKHISIHCLIISLVKLFF